MPVIALLGSGEFEPWCRPVDGWCAERATGQSDRALIVPTASAAEGDHVFDDWGAKGIEHYRAIGLSPEVVPLRTRDDAFDPAIAGTVAGAGVIFFSGGNPGYLAETLSGSPFWDEVCRGVARGTALGGCSAGAVFLGTLAPFVTEEQLRYWVPGLRLLARAFVLPHFDMLDTYAAGLRQLFIDATPEGSTAVGLDENTAIFGDGERWTVAGKGGAWFRRDGTPDLVPYRDGEKTVVALGLSLPS